MKIKYGIINSLAENPRPTYFQKKIIPLRCHPERSVGTHLIPVKKMPLKMVKYLSSAE